MRKAETPDDMTLYRKYRPRNFDEFKGAQNKATVLGILQAIDDEKHHAFLITGPTGTGKTTIARLIADALGCHPAMFLEMDTANTRGIDTIRELISDCEYEPVLGNVKVVLLDECHQITGPAAAALLKFLEDTPQHVYVILCTTDPDKLLETIKNRCSRWEVHSLTQAELTRLIDDVLEKEKKNVPPAVKKNIVLVSEGCPRQALVLLGQIMNVEGETNQLQIIADAVIDVVEVKDICSRIKAKGFWTDKEVAGAKQQGLCHLLEGLKQDPETVRRGILGWFSKVLLNPRDQKDAIRIVAIMDCFSPPLFNTGKAGLIMACWKALQVG